MSIKLGVNIDHVATLRQARGTNYPCPVDAAQLCEKAGAHSITAHLREDRRHIADADVLALRERIATRLNLEMANAPDIVQIALAAKPDEVCLVPERREELTTEGGLDVVGQEAELKKTVDLFKLADIAVSFFVDPEPAQIEAAARLGVPMVELHTGEFAESVGEARAHEIERLQKAAVLAHAAGMQVNAGHGLSIDNIDGIFSVPHLDTLNIGHSIVSRAVFLGLPEAVGEMLQAMSGYGSST